jgi:hypothetical protein
MSSVLRLATGTTMAVLAIIGPAALAPPPAGSAVRLIAAAAAGGRLTAVPRPAATAAGPGPAS